MICPYCDTENRDEMEKCYHCGNDLSMLRLVVNKAKQHYNVALEHAERQRYNEAIHELHDTLELHSDFPSAHVVLGTIYAKQEQYEEARVEWENAIALDPNCKKAYAYLNKLERVRQSLPTLRRLTVMVWFLAFIAIASFIGLIFTLKPEPDMGLLNEAIKTFSIEKDFGLALESLDKLRNSNSTQVALAAEQWDRLIIERMENDLTAIDHHLNTDQLSMALGSAMNMKKKNPPAKYQDQLNGKIEILRTASMKEWDEKVQHVKDNRMAFDELLTLSQTIAAAFPDDENLEKMKNDLEAIRATSPDNKLAALREEYQSGQRSTEDCLIAIQRVLRDHPDHSDSQDFLASLLLKRFDALSTSFTDAMAKNQITQGMQFFLELKKLGAESDLINQKVLQIGFDVLLKSYKNAIDKGEIIQADKLLSEITELADQDDSGKVVESLRIERYDILSKTFSKALEAGDWEKSDHFLQQLVVLAEQDPSGKMKSTLIPSAYEQYEAKFSALIRKDNIQDAAPLLERMRQTAKLDQSGKQTNLFIQSATTAMTKGFESAIARKDTARARDYLHELQAIAQESDAPAFATTVSKIKDQYNETLKQGELERIANLKLDDFLKDPKAFTTPEVFTGEELKELEGEILKAKKRIAYTGGDWLVKKDGAYQILAISPELAEQTVRLAQVVMEHYPGDVNAKCLFYLGAAHTRLGNTVEAQKAFSELRSAYPQSVYVGLSEKVMAQAQSKKD